MGLFDSWRRKKAKPSIVTKPRDVKKVVSGPVVDESKESGDHESIATLLGEYQDLVQRRDALSVERKALTKKLENGEIEAAEFRKELMFRIQEAAKVSETLRETTA